MSTYSLVELERFQTRVAEKTWSSYFNVTRWLCLQFKFITPSLKPIISFSQTCYLKQTQRIRLEIRTFSHVK